METKDAYTQNQEERVEISEAHNEERQFGELDTHRTY